MRKRSGTPCLGSHAPCGPALAVTAVLLGFVAPSIAPAPLLAQERAEPETVREPTIVGVVAGWNRTEGVWKPTSESEWVGGPILGGFVNARTSLPWFAVRAEIVWARRGVDVLDSGTGVPAGGVRADYLTLTLHPRASVRAGPFRVHVAGGPVVEQVLRRRVDPALTPVLNREVGTSFGVSAGAGVGITLAGRYRVEVEARRFEGLSDAHAGDFVSVRNRSLEFVTRLGIPRPRP